jgi:hypothetical protein
MKAPGFGFNPLVEAYEVRNKVCFQCRRTATGFTVCFQMQLVPLYATDSLAGGGEDSEVGGRRHP